MRLFETWVSRHRRLRDAHVSFQHTDGNSVLHGLYGRLGLTLLAGPNGSGKTSLLSFIAQLFHNAERFPERIEGAFSLTFGSRLVQGGQRQLCTLYRNHATGPVRAKVQGEFDGPISKWRKDRPPLPHGADGIDFKDVVPYLPPIVIVSAFSLHGEYPTNRPKNFVGDQRVAMYDISNLYGYNHFRFPTFSPAIVKLMNSVVEGAPGVRMLEELLGGKFSGRVRIFHRWFDPQRDDDAEWTVFGPKVVKAEKQGHIFINDFEINLANGAALTLSNMSSGQKMLLVRLLSVLSEIRDGAVVVIEEPEIHLDPAWSRQLISLLLLFFKDYDAHMLVATHSFSLLNAVPSDCVLLAQEGQFSSPRTPTLLANESALAKMVYEPAAHVVEEQIRAYASKATIPEMEGLLRMLGESSVRFEVFARLVETKKGQDAQSV